MNNGKKFCSNCGKEIDVNADICVNCGVAVNKNNTVVTTKNVREDNIPEEYRPISMWGYFGYEILFSIPLVGFILLLVFSFGGTRNKNLKNFARSYFCLLIILVILLVIVLVSGGLFASQL